MTKRKGSRRGKFIYLQTNKQKTQRTNNLSPTTNTNTYTNPLKKKNLDFSILTEENAIELGTFKIFKSHKINRKKVNKSI